MRVDGLHCMAGEEYIRVDEYEKLDAVNQKLKAEVERLKKEVSFWQCGGCESCENSGENDECNYSGVCCEDRRNGFILKEE